jgi:hypothetical protein
MEAKNWWILLIGITLLAGLTGFLVYWLGFRKLVNPTKVTDLKLWNTHNGTQVDFNPGEDIIARIAVRNGFFLPEELVWQISLDNQATWQTPTIKSSFSTGTHFSTTERTPPHQYFFLRVLRASNLQPLRDPVPFRIGQTVEALEGIGTHGLGETVRASTTYLIYFQWDEIVFPKATTTFQMWESSQNASQTTTFGLQPPGEWAKVDDAYGKMDYDQKLLRWLTRPNAFEGDQYAWWKLDVIVGGVTVTSVISAAMSTYNPNNTGFFIKSIDILSSGASQQPGPQVLSRTSQPKIRVVYNNQWPSAVGSQPVFHALITANGVEQDVPFSNLTQQSDTDSTRYYIWNALPEVNAASYTLGLMISTSGDDKFMQYQNTVTDGFGAVLAVTNLPPNNIYLYQQTIALLLTTRGSPYQAPTWQESSDGVNWVPIAPGRVTAGKGTGACNLTAPTSNVNTYWIQAAFSNIIPAGLPYPLVIQASLDDFTIQSLAFDSSSTQLVQGTTVVLDLVFSGSMTASEAVGSIKWYQSVSTGDDEGTLMGAPPRFQFISVDRGIHTATFQWTVPAVLTTELMVRAVQVSDRVLEASTGRVSVVQQADLLGITISNSAGMHHVGDTLILDVHFQGENLSTLTWTFTLNQAPWVTSDPVPQSGAPTGHAYYQWKVPSGTLGVVVISPGAGIKTDPISVGPDCSWDFPNNKMIEPLYVSSLNPINPLNYVYQTTLTMAVGVDLSNPLVNIQLSFHTPDGKQTIIPRADMAICRDSSTSARVYWKADALKALKLPNVAIFCVQLYTVSFSMIYQSDSGISIDTWDLQRQDSIIGVLFPGVPADWLQKYLPMPDDRIFVAMKPNLAEVEKTGNILTGSMWCVRESDGVDSYDYEHIQVYWRKNGLDGELVLMGTEYETKTEPTQESLWQWEKLPVSSSQLRTYALRIYGTLWYIDTSDNSVKSESDSKDGMYLNLQPSQAPLTLKPISSFV